MDINWYRLDLKDVNSSDIDTILEAGINGFESKSSHSIFISQNFIKILSTHSPFFEQPKLLFEKQFDTLQKLINIQKSTSYIIPGPEIGAMNSISNTILKLCDFSYSLLVGLNYHKDQSRAKEFMNLLIDVLRFNQSYELLNSEKVNLGFNKFSLTIAVSDTESLKIFGIINVLNKFISESWRRFTLPSPFVWYIWGRVNRNIVYP